MQMVSWTGEDLWARHFHFEICRLYKGFAGNLDISHRRYWKIKKSLDLQLGTEETCDHWRRSVLGTGSDRIRTFSLDPDPGSSPPDTDPDPALVIYIYQVIVSKQMFLTNFFEKMSWYWQHVNVFTLHYVNGINGRIHFQRWIRSVLKGWIRIRSKPDWVPNIDGDGCTVGMYDMSQGIICSYPLSATRQQLEATAMLNQLQKTFTTETGAILSM